MIHFTSDNHFGHRNIVKYCGRPDDHEERMLRGLSLVGPDDELFHLGDVVFRSKRAEAHAFLDEHMPSCRHLCFLEGNHDRRTRVRTWPGWSRVIRYKQSLILSRLPGMGDFMVMLSHRPQDLSHAGRDIDVVIHGHIHDVGKPWGWRDFEGKPQLWVNVCVEQWGYIPVSWEIIRDVWYHKICWDVPEYRLTVR